jgi:hypothetical protein
VPPKPLQLLSLPPCSAPGSIARVVPIPNVATLAGAAVFFQTLALDAAQPNPIGARTSNGLELRIRNVQ